MHLYFLRHGEAGMNFPSDFDRELTEAGISASQYVGKFCAHKSIVFTHALVSPLIRARQTAKLVLENLPSIEPEETDSLTPETDPKNLFLMLRSFSSDSKVLLVTHEPFVSRCISTLISGTETVNITMKPATFACVETVGAPSRGNGRLLWHIPAEIIKSV